MVSFQKPNWVGTGFCLIFNSAELWQADLLGAHQTSTGLIMSVRPSGQLLTAPSNHIDSQYSGTTANIIMHNAWLNTSVHNPQVQCFILKRCNLTWVKTPRDWSALSTKYWWVEMFSQSINTSADAWSGPSDTRREWHWLLSSSHSRYGLSSAWGSTHRRGSVLFYWFQFKPRRRP